MLCFLHQGLSELCSHSLDHAPEVVSVRKVPVFGHLLREVAHHKLVAGHLWKDGWQA